MEFVRSLRHLWHHVLFRRLIAVRVAAQSSDGVFQIGLASFVLFSPQRQPDAVAIATVLAITLLPFSILGPFVSVVLDRWSRRQILVIADLLRAGLVIALALLVSTNLQAQWVELVFYGGVLLAMSMNRFILATLSASLPHTIDEDEYLIANAVVPTIGPAGAMVGAGIGTVLRLTVGSQVPSYTADAMLFTLAGLGFVVSATLSLRIPRHRLGPDDVEPARARDIAVGLVEALRHLGERRPAALGLATIGVQRIAYGLVTVTMILLYRNYFHEVTEVEVAIADLGLLLGVTGAGFVLASVVCPPGTARAGVRGWMIICLFASAVLQVVPGAIISRVPLLIAGFLLGITAQSLKICVDTLVQAHVDDHVKGRVFVLYDMIFNVALVLAGVLAAFILPPDGHSVPVLVTVGVVYALIGAAFAVASRGLPMNEGTESLLADKSGS